MQDNVAAVLLRVPIPLKEALVARARQNRRTMNGEAITVLEQVITPAAPASQPATSEAPPASSS